MELNKRKHPLMRLGEFLVKPDFFSVQVAFEDLVVSAVRSVAIVFAGALIGAAIDQAPLVHGLVLPFFAGLVVYRAGTTTIDGLYYLGGVIPSALMPGPESEE